MFFFFSLKIDLYKYNEYFPLTQSIIRKALSINSFYKNNLKRYVFLNVDNFNVKIFYTCVYFDIYVELLLLLLV